VFNTDFVIPGRISRFGPRARTLLIGAIAIVGLLLLLKYPIVCTVRGSAGGTLFWNGNEALLFMDENSDGARMSYVRYALEPLLVSMGDVRPPDNERCSKILVIQVTDKDLQRFDTDLYRYTGEDRGCVFKYELFWGQIYAVSWPRLWKWSGTDFERATPEEYGAYATALASGETVSQHPWEFDNVDGWSMREFGASAPRYELTIGGQPATIIFHGKTWPPEPLSIELIRPGQPPQTIWSFDGRARRVSEAEYDHVFPPR
jgi:hypothetical protein